MILSQNEFSYFLNNLTPTMMKGFILHIRLNYLENPITEDILQEIKNLLNLTEKEKKCQILQSPDTNSIFLYFPENYKDDISALLIKIQFNLGTSINTDLKKDNNVFGIYQIKENLSLLKTLASTENTFFQSKTEKVFQLHPILPETTFSIPFTPTLLSHLEKTLAQADLSNLMRRQAVCALVGNSKPIELFEEIYVALADLKKALCPTVDIYQSPYLLDRLLETLDKRVLENISHHDAGAFRKNFSLNIAVKTILSQDFQAFNDSISSEDKKSILLEIKQHDIFANLPAFLNARAFIKEQGYRLCIDMVTEDSLSLILREKLEADFIKLMWSPALLENAQNKDFIHAIKFNDPNQIILCRVDDKRAIELGQTLGISLYQGYYIQKLLYQAPKPKKT